MPSARPITISAPAKVNLLLRVHGRRPDGYHDIETVFELVDLCDELVCISHTPDVTLTCSDPTLSCGEDNLIVRAARLLQEAAGCGLGASITLTKRIPIAAGLGGGSSDAAAALVALNQLWQLKLSRTELIRLAGMLGADVPFFLCGARFAIGSGRGDICEPIEGKGVIAHVVVVPDAQLSTPEVYRGAQISLTPPGQSARLMAHALRNGSLGELATGLWNDLEPEAIRRCPVIADIRQHLRQAGCVGVMVSGSGPSVIGLCPDITEAERIAARLRAASAWRIECVQTFSRPFLSNSSDNA